MAAYICECVEVSLRTTNDNCRLIRDVDHLEITGPGQFRLMAGQNPITHNDALKLKHIYSRVCVETPIERMTRFLAGDQLIYRHLVLRHHEQPARYNNYVIRRLR
ncbi:MAG: hypothetical protein OEN22_07840 [Gammaproteobacteria bacterium]|nr:hypothetical protein [Gammaproteobacteria bacterium]